MLLSTGLRRRALYHLCDLFGAAVSWPKGFAARGTDGLAALLSGAAFVALYRFKADVLWVVLAGNLIGLLHVLLFR